MAVGVETGRILTDKLFGSVKKDRPGLAAMLHHAAPVTPLSSLPSTGSADLSPK